MVFYRKYRPQTINELDLTSVRERLTAILSVGEVPHAFLFAGPKGLGKTSSARILAKAISCEKKSEVGSWKLEEEVGSEKKKNQKISLQDPASHISPLTSNIEPCNNCAACTSITNGSNIDVIEIDAASNRGIDEIRDLREKIKFSPASLAKKIYIIDEVHMLTTEAFNALLKTLEEPPSHAVFVLATTEMWKLPATIVSRTFYVPFEKPTKEEVVRCLTRIIKGEKLEVDEDVFDRLFSLADGAFRDAAKLLEELALAAKGQKITKDLIEKSFKAESIDGEVENIISALSTKDAKEALFAIDRLSQKGCDFKTVNEKIVERLHHLLLVKSGVEKGSTKEFDTNSIETLIELFTDSYKNLKISPLPQLPLELAVMKWTMREQVQSSKFKPARNATQSVAGGVQSSEKEKKEKAQSLNVGKTINGATQNDFLAKLIAAVKKENVSVAGVLRSCRLAAITDSTVEFIAPYKFHSDKLSDIKTVMLLEKLSGELLGRQVKIRVQTK